MRRLVSVVALLLPIVGGCKQDAVTLVETTARGPEGRPVGVIPSFTPVKVRAIPFMEEGWVRVVDGPALGEVRRDAIGVLPLETTTFHVAMAQTELRLKHTTRRLLGCTAIAGVAAKTDDGEVIVVVEEGRPIGVVRQRETTPSRPTADAFWAMTRQALRELRADDAATAAEATLTCDPGHAAAREVLAALVGKDDPARSAELLARRKATPEPLPAVSSGAALGAGAVAYVIATDETLRSEARADAPVVAALPIGTSVRVLEVDGAFARVQSLAGDLVVELPDPFAGAAVAADDDDADNADDATAGGADAPDAAAKTPPPPGGAPPSPAVPADPGGADPLAKAVRDVLRTGHVAAGALALAAPEAERQKTEAAALGPTAQAVVLWQRIVALEPGRDDLRKTLVDVALKADRPREAALALHTPARHAGRSQLVASMETLRGCVGDVRRATVVDGERVTAEQLTGDVCVDFDPRPACLDRNCPDDYEDIGCDCGEGTHDDHDDAADAGPERPAAVVEAEAQAARAREEAEAAEAAATAAREEAEAAEARIALVADVEAKKARTAQLDALLPRGPFVRLSLRQLETLPPGTTLHLARLEIERTCSEDGGEPLEDIEATFAPQPVPLPTPRPQGEFVVWFEATPGATYGLFRVGAGEPGPESGSELTHRREARIAEVDVPDSEPDCSCTPWCWR